MIPPLGTYSPETRHLNLKWTIGDHDRAFFARKNQHMTVEQLSEKLRGTQLACTPARFREICQAFGIKVAKSFYEANA